MAKKYFGETNQSDVLQVMIDLIVGCLTYMKTLKKLFVFKLILRFFFVNADQNILKNFFENRYLQNI